jgi:hypothetical protein
MPHAGDVRWWRDPVTPQSSMMNSHGSPSLGKSNPKKSEDPFQSYSRKNDSCFEVRRVKLDSMI